MEKKVLDAISKYKLIAKGDKLAVGISGGADSVALIYALNNMKEALGFDIFAVHVNHMIRHVEASRDEDYVRTLCKSLNIPLEVYKKDCPEYSATHKLGLEESARVLRYEAFHQASTYFGCNKIAVAHNLNDNIETMLMRLLRGTSAYGLRGIDIRKDDIIRPLLYCSREEIEEYLKRNGIFHITDSTNEDFNYTRNKIRGQLIPHLESEYNPNIINALSRLSEGLKTDAGYFNGETKKAYDKYVREHEYWLEISKELPGYEHASISERLIRKCVRTLTGDDKDFDNIHMKLVMDLFTMKSGKQINLTKELGASNAFGNVALYKNMHQSYKDAPVNVGDFVFADEQCGWLCISLESPKFVENFQNTYTGVYLCDKITGNLVLRRRRNGDIIKPHRGSRIKFKDFLIDKRVPQFLRDSILVLAAGNEIISVLSGINYTSSGMENGSTALYISLWRKNDGR